VNFFYAQNQLNIWHCYEFLHFKFVSIFSKRHAQGVCFFLRVLAQTA